MNTKANAMEIISFGKPERVLTSLPAYVASYHGANHQSFEDYKVADGHDKSVGSKWYDIWGTGWHKEYPGVMGFPRINPLAEIASLSDYVWPKPDDERICHKIYTEVEQFNAMPDKSEKFLFGSHRDTLWEKSYMLVGMENMMEYFFTEPEYAKEVLHNIMDFQIGIAKHYINTGVEVVELGDDMGTQAGLLLGKNIFNKFLLPEYRRLFEFYKSHNVFICFHSCGYIESLLESFIELGVDVLNPVQATANNLSRVIEITQGRMALQGGISTDLIMTGTPEQIRQTVKDTIMLLGKRGGYFCSPDQYLPFPDESIAVFDEAVAEFGRYSAIKDS